VTRPIAGAFSPLPPFGASLDWTVGTVQTPMVLESDPRTGKMLFVPERQRSFWIWFLDNRPDLANELSQQRLAALELTTPSPD
jgi:hypothetical protein